MKLQPVGGGSRVVPGGGRAPGDVVRNVGIQNKILQPRPKVDELHKVLHREAISKVQMSNPSIVAEGLLHGPFFVLA